MQPFNTLQWRRSTKCSNTQCVEVAENSTEFYVRDSKDTDSPVLAFDRAGWGAFISGIRSGVV